MRRAHAQAESGDHRGAAEMLWTARDFTGAVSLWTGAKCFEDIYNKVPWPASRFLWLVASC